MHEKKKKKLAWKQNTEKSLFKSQVGGMNKIARDVIRD